MAAKLIARSDDLEALAAGVRKGLKILSGWRYEQFGKDALDLVEGRLAFAIENGKLKMSRIAWSRRARKRRCVSSLLHRSGVARGVLDCILRRPPVHGETPGYVCHDNGLGSFRRPARERPSLAAKCCAAAGARTIRWVPFGAMITMEFSA